MLVNGTVSRHNGYLSRNSWRNSLIKRRKNHFYGQTDMNFVNQVDWNTRFGYES